MGARVSWKASRLIACRGVGWKDWSAGRVAFSGGGGAAASTLPLTKMSHPRRLGQPTVQEPSWALRSGA